MKHIAKRSNTPLNGLLLGWSDTPESETITPVWDTSREGHLITIAPTGSGKGVSCAIPALLTWQGPTIVVDPRGENYAVTAERRRAMGHIVHRLDPFKIAGDDEGDSLNPMDLIDPNADDFEDNAAVVAHLCMQGGSLGHSDPFWDERASTLVVKIIVSLFERMQRRPTLADVQNILKKGAVHDDTLQDAFPTIDEQNLKTPRLTLIQVLNASEFASERTLSSILATANSHLGFLRSPAVHSSLTSSTIHLDDITAGAMQTIYLIIPPDKLISHGKLIRLWIGVMLAAISRRRRAPPQPTLFIIDEAAQLGEVNEIRSALTLMRAYGMRVWLFFQDMSQLQAVYKKDWESIMNNCKIQQFFGAKSPHAKKALQTYLGDTLPLDRLTADGMALFNGETLTTVRRANYLHDPVFKGLASPHPFHQQQPELTLQ